MRVEALKKTTIKKVVIRLVLVVVAIAGYLTVSSIQEDLSTRLGRLNALTRGVNTEIQKLEEQVAVANASLDLYKQLEESKNKNAKGLDRSALAEVIEPLRERYYLTSLSLKMTPVTVLTDPQFTKGTLQVEHTLVTLNFAGITDELLFSFIDLMLRQVPGYMQVDYIRMERKENLTQDYLKDLAKERYNPLVEGEMAFHWIALKDKDTGGAAGAP